MEQKLDEHLQLPTVKHTRKVRCHVQRKCLHTIKKPGVTCLTPDNLIITRVFRSRKKATAIATSWSLSLLRAFMTDVKRR